MGILLKCLGDSGEEGKLPLKELRTTLDLLMPKNNSKDK